MAYTPLKTANYEAIIKAFGIDAMAGRRPLEGPLQVLVIAYMPVATTWSRKKTASALAGVIRPGRPDADNLLKAVADALNGVVWRDDAQIAEATISKRYDSAAAAGDRSVGTGRMTMTQSRQRLPRDPLTLNFKPGLRARVHAVAEAEQRTFTETVNNLVERGLAADQRLIDGFGSVAGYTMARSIVHG